MRFFMTVLGCIVIGLVNCQENGTLTTSPVRLTQDDQCPPWFFYNATTKQCECYSSPSTDDVVKCTEQEALLRIGYCMTHEN